MSHPPEQPYYQQQPEYPPQQPQYPQSGQPYYPQQQQPDYPPQQPGYQQPGYQQPYYQQREPGQYPQQPGYPQSDYGQDYQHGYPQSGPPAPPVAPKKRRSAGKIVLIVVAVLVVLCGGGAAVAYVAFKDDVENVVDAANTRVVAPETLAGRAKITDPSLVKVADEMVNGMKKDIENETSAVGAFYGDPAKQDMIMIAGASGRIQNPSKELDDAFTELSGTSGLKVSPAKDVDAGPLGGEAKCADGNADGVPVAMCVWADNGSVGVVAFYFKKVDQIKADFVKVRGEVEKRN
jgi:hypothetical protein